MYNVNVIDQNNNNVTIDVVRYFKTATDSYFIYSLKETDESGFVKLYAAKLIDNKVLGKIESEIEWNQVKELIKVIVKEAKDGLVSVEDQDYTKLKNMQITSNRVFKLTAAVADMLGANKKEFKEEVIPVMEPVKETAPELVFETPMVAPVMEVKPEEEAQLEERIVKKISTLEELLGEGPKEEETAFTLSPEPLATPVFEVKQAPVSDNLDKVVEELQAKIAAYEAKLNQIRELLK